MSGMNNFKLYLEVYTIIFRITSAVSNDRGDLCEYHKRKQPEASILYLGRVLTANSTDPFTYSEIYYVDTVCNSR